MGPDLGRLNERRAAHRQSAVHDHGIVLARIRPGREALLWNISAGGALVETLQRLAPGAPIALTFETEDRWASVRGRILRCEVSKVSATSISYVGAIEFSGGLFWLPKDPASTPRRGA